MVVDADGIWMQQRMQKTLLMLQIEINYKLQVDIFSLL